MSEKKYSKQHFTETVFLNPGGIFTFKSGWISRNSKGDWNGWIQDRPFSWIRTGDKYSTHKIQCAGQTLQWSAWSMAKHFSLNGEDWSLLDQHSPAIRASQQSEELH